jgi:putative nucleotidyltransferase with HDIG domain
MDRSEALALVREYVKNENLVRHMLSVEAAMRFYAEKTGQDLEAWGLLGLIHDFDWEIHPTLEQHPMDGAPILRQRGVPEDIIQDILSHAERTGVPRDTPRRTALYACDEVTGLITAVALVRPSRSLLDLEASSVKKKWKDKAFAAGTDRAEMERRRLRRSREHGECHPGDAQLRRIWGWWEHSAIMVEPYAPDVVFFAAHPMP